MTEGPILAPEPHEHVCHNCRAWAPWSSIAVVRQNGDVIGHRPTGQCRIRAPLAGEPEAYGDRPAIWPIINGEDWCCEFSKAEP